MTPAQVAHIMPPLPKPLTLSRGDEDGAIQLGYTAEQMQAYARAAVEAALRDAPQQAEGWGVDVNKLLSNAMKPSEIAGPADAQRRRVGELLSWFARLADGQANPKWTTEHAFELAYYIAATPSAPTAVEPTSEEVSVVEPRDERQDFEAAYRARYPVSCELDPQKFNLSAEGDYEDIRVSIAWAMWQARASKGTPK